MRGTQKYDDKISGETRFIPAHAGNTAPNSPPMPKRTVHPRACGEHLAMLYTVFLCTGSSPRMRGTLNDRVVLVDHERFIPAHAGNTHAKTIRRRLISVHPRACGEHTPPEHSKKPSFGSSPRMRGTLFGPVAIKSPPRFIPAHAGNTCQVHAAIQCRPVHPRACGEHILGNRFVE